MFFFAIFYQIQNAWKCFFIWLIEWYSFSDDLNISFLSNLGEAAFSEPESRAIRDGLLGLSGRVKMYFTLHAFSQFWMMPYGYTYNRPHNYGEMVRSYL